MRIQNNIAAFDIWTSYTSNINNMQKSMNHLSTGLKTVVDDPAGVGISERMRAQADGSAMARNNVDNGISMVQTADSWLQKINDMLSRMSELAIEANDGTKSATDKENVQTEFSEMQSEITRITSKYTAAAKFNGLYLFRGGNGVAALSATSSGSTPSVPFDAYDYNSWTTAQQDRVASDIAAFNSTTVADAKNHLALINGDAMAMDMDVNPAVGFNLGDSSTWPSWFGSQPSGSSSGGDQVGTGKLSIQVGADVDQTIDLNLANLEVQNTEAIGTVVSFSYNSSHVVTASSRSVVQWASVIDTNKLSAAASDAVGKLAKAIDHIANTRASLGAQQKRLEQTRAGLLGYEDNLRAAESKIRDVDMARESTTFTKYQVLGQASNAMLAQANQLPSQVLQLLG